MDSALSPLILGFVGSPRRGGNTDVLVSAALASAAETGAATELVHLGGLTIGECDGCHACWRGRECPRQDDMNGLYGRMAAASAFVFGTPVYWYGVTGLMKLLLDRLVYFNCPEHRALVRGKRAAVVVPFEEEDPAMAAGVLEMLRKSCGYLELELAGTLTVPGVTRRGEVAEQAAVLAQARELGRKLVSR